MFGGNRMKLQIACPAGMWAKKLFTLDRFEKIDFFLDEKEGEFKFYGACKKIHNYEYINQVDKESLVIIITDSKRYEAIKELLEKYGLQENKHFFNGWKLSHQFYSICDVAEEWIEFEKNNENALSNMHCGWDKRSKLMAELIPEDVKSILDIGCGEGLIRKYLSKDIKYYGLDYVKRGEHVSYVCDINQERLPSINVDLIFIAGVLGYVNDIRNFVQQLKNAKYILMSKRRTEIYTRLDASVTDGYMNYGKTEYYINDLINDMYVAGYICSKMDWPWRERDEYYILFKKVELL